MEDPFILRSAERLIAVMIGGLAIWLGFRLFLAIPDQQAESGAELSLSKDKRLILTRIGPGVFFALFGTAIVVSSYYFRVETGEGTTGFSAAPIERASSSEVSPAASTAPLALDRASELIRFLEEAEAGLAEATSGMNEADAEIERNWNRVQFRNAKVAILARAWRYEWGDPDLFLDWLREEPPRSRNPGYEAALAILEPTP